MDPERRPTEGTFPQKKVENLLFSGKHNTDMENFNMKNQEKLKKIRNALEKNGNRGYIFGLIQCF